MKRLVLAATVAAWAALIAFIEPREGAGAGGDLSQAWYSAVAVVNGANPYEVIGPGREFHHDYPLLYPLTTAVAALPLAFMPEQAAGLVFIAVSSALLAFGVTRYGWHHLPIFLSPPFIGAVKLVQWSPLLTAALCIPGLAWTFALKPNIGLALFAAGRSMRTNVIAASGGLLLIVISLLLLPTWPLEWWEATRGAAHVRPPILQPGGFLVLLALLKWRRWDARLIIALALVPQTIAWYDALPLLLVARSLRQSLLLTAAGSLGFLVYVLTDWPLEPLLVLFAYVPAMLLVLRRPNGAAR